MKPRRDMKSRMDRGAVFVEFALTVPLILLMLVAFAEFGWYFSKRCWVEQLVFQAAHSAGEAAPNTRPDLVQKLIAEWFTAHNTAGVTPNPPTAVITTTPVTVGVPISAAVTENLLMERIHVELHLQVEPLLLRVGMTLGMNVQGDGPVLFTDEQNIIHAVGYANPPKLWETYDNGDHVPRVRECAASPTCGYMPTSVY
jgi:Flp pilus assembly protein TadG